MTARPLSGPHYCIGTALAVIDLVIGHLHDCCDVNRGQLTRADLSAYQARLRESLASLDLSWAEDGFSRCMHAHSHSRFTLRRETILSALLCMRTEQTTRNAFPIHIDRYGPLWLAVFYDALAAFISEQVSASLENRLFAAYARLATLCGHDLSAADIDGDGQLSMLLCEALVMLTAADARRDRAAAFARALNQALAGLIGQSPDGPTPIGPAQIDAFLARLRYSLGFAP